MSHERHSGAAVKLPQLEVGVEDAVSEDFEDPVEFGTLWVVGEVSAEDVVNGFGVASEEKLHVAEPGAFPVEGAAGFG